MLMKDVRVGMRLRSKTESIPRVVTVIELTEKGFRYQCEKHTVKIGPYEFGEVMGGEHYGHEGECLYEPLKEEYQRPHKCPRRSEVPGMDDPESPFVIAQKMDDWKKPKDGRSELCTFCGSMDPEEFMAALHGGQVTLTPTDKNYKVYVTGYGWNHQKFYFQHLSQEQKQEFIELLNARKLNLAHPGHFYNMPYFIQSVPRG